MEEVENENNLISLIKVPEKEREKIKQKFELNIRSVELSIKTNFKYHQNRHKSSL